MTIDEILELQHDVHNRAKSKGWHDKKRSYHTWQALHLTETAELTEAYRHGTENDQCDKPVALTQKEEELADIYIRTLDYRGLLGQTSFKGFIVEGIHDKTKRMFLSAGPNASDHIGVLNEMIVLAFIRRSRFDYILIACEIFAELHEIDLYNAVMLKNAYNETRPHMHGGKKF